MNKISAFLVFIGIIFDIIIFLIISCYEYKILTNE